MKLKRRLILLFIFLILIIPSLYLIKPFIFGKAISSTFSASVTVVSNTPPNLTLYHSSNRNYTYGENIKIEYEVMDNDGVSSIWYNLNNGTNTTLPTPSDGNTAKSYLNASNGNYVFYIFANDTGNRVNNSVNSMFYVVNFTKREEINVPDNGVVNFSDYPDINQFIKNITGVNSSWTINITLYNNITPENWTIPTNIENVKFYFELSANTDDSSGSYTLYFNLSTDHLSGTPPGDVRGFFFNNNIWNELSTRVENSASDPIEFSAVLTHLSQFLIGEKVSTSSNGGRSAGDPSSRSSSEGGIEKPKIEQPSIPEPGIPEIQKPEDTKEKLKKRLPLKIKELEQPSLSNMLITFLILIIAIIIMLYEDKNKRKGKFLKK